MTPADTPAPMTDEQWTEVQSVVLMAMGGKDFGKPGTKVDLLMHHRICKAVRPLIERHRSSPSTAGGGSDLQARISTLEGELADERMEHGLLKELLSRPEIDEFYEGVMLEAAHQRQRWGDAHDREKSAENWYWLVGYLAGKALRSAIEGNQDKARHHTISAAAALFQWHKSIKDHVNGIGRDTDLAGLDAAPLPEPPQ